MRKTLCVVLMAVLMTAAVFATATEEAGSDGPIQISWMLPTWIQPIPSDVDPNDNKFADAIAAGVPGIEIDWIFVDGYQEAANLRIASGDMPDVFDPGTYFVRGVREGLWRDMGPVVESMQYLDKQYQYEELLGYVTVDGTIWAIPTDSGELNNPRGLAIRRDWLEALDLEMPTSMEETLEVMRAFTFDDPDGNGIDDTYGTGFHKDFGFADWAFHPLGLHGFEFSSGINAMTRVNGELVPDIVNPRMEESLEFMRRAWELGVVDPDSPVQEFGQFWGRARPGLYGVASMAANGILNVANAGWQSQGVDNEFVLVNPPVTGPYGDQGTRSNSILYHDYVVPSDRPEEVAFAAGEVVDFFLDEGWIIANVGLEEGRHFENIEGADGEVFQTSRGRSVDDEDWRLAYRVSMADQHWGSPEYRARYNQARVDAGLAHPDYVEIIRLNSTPGIGKLNPYKVPSELMAEAKINLEPRFFEIATRIVIGELPLSAFDEWLDYFYSNGGEEALEELNRLNP